MLSQDDKVENQKNKKKDEYSRSIKIVRQSYYYEKGNDDDDDKNIFARQSGVRDAKGNFTLIELLNMLDSYELYPGY